MPDTLPALLHACVDSGYVPSTMTDLAGALESRLPSLSGDASRISGLARDIREAASPEARTAAARQLAATTSGCACSGDEPPEPGVREEEEAVELLGERALAPVRLLLAQGLL